MERGRAHTHCPPIKPLPLIINIKRYDGFVMAVVATRRVLPNKEKKKNLGVPLPRKIAKKPQTKQKGVISLKYNTVLSTGKDYMTMLSQMSKILRGLLAIL